MFGKRKSRTLGLALGGGSSRGWAHIGVIKALSDADIRVDYIAGVSIGAFVGAFFCAGKLALLEEYTRQLNWRSILTSFDPVFPKSGLLDGKKLTQLISDQKDMQSFAQLAHPLRIVTTDLLSGREVVLNSGNLAEAVRASVAVPGILTPVKYNDCLLVDGALVNPVPVNIVKQMGADCVIAVDLNVNRASERAARRKKQTRREALKAFLMESNSSSSEKLGSNQFIKKLQKYFKSTDSAIRERLFQWLSSEEPLPNIFDIFGTSFSIMQERIATINALVNPPELTVKPQLGHLKFLDFDQAESTIREGYAATEPHIADIKKLIGKN